MNLLDAKRKLLPMSGYMSMGGGGGGGGPSSTTSYQTNIPEYARPYVESMLAGTQRQLFQGKEGENGAFEITGFQPYKAYGGTYDESGNQTSYDPSKGIAGFQPMQQQAFKNAANMESNPTSFATDVGSYMSPYAMNALKPQLNEMQRRADIQGTQQQAQATQAGAFGGARDILQRTERERNLGQQQADVIAQGMQSAFNSAQNQYNTGIQQNLGINALQAQFGGQQQGLEQQKLNQAMQDYANAQQYPLMQLGTMSNMIRGLPMQASTSNQYVAQPNTLTQAIGAAGTGASLYNAFNTPAKAAGGIISYDVGGEVKGNLENMDDEGLQRQLKESSSPSVKRMAQQILRERQMEKQSPQPSYAGGGIIAFAEPNKQNNYSLVNGAPIPEEPLTSSEILQQRVMQGKPVGDVTAQPVGIMQAAPAATAPVPTPKVEDTLGDLSPFYKSMYLKADAIAKQPRQEIAAELKAEAGPNVGAQEMRAKVMAERASAKDEAERQRYIRAAEFFATWGSTPGPTLVAGMTAVKANVGNIIADEKEAKKIRMEIDKSIYALDEATRLEEKGYMDKADSIKEKQAANMMKVNEFLVRAKEDQAKIAAEHKKQADYLIGQAQIHRDDAIAHASSAAEVARINGNFHKEVANIQGSFGLGQAKISAKSHEKGYEMQNQHYDQRAVDTLLGEERKAQSDIDRIKRDPDVGMNMRILEMAKDPKNNISPEQAAMAKKLVDEKLGDAPTRLEGIRTERQRVQDRLAGKKPSDAPENDPLKVR
jgi:hypothetical protein